MATIKIKDLSFSYPYTGETVFEHLSLNLDTDWRLGLIGRNGKGKTTLLRLILGELESGNSIEMPLQSAMLPRAVEQPSLMALDAIAPLCYGAQDWQIICELNRLNVPSEILYRPYNTLSGGEMTKLQLCCMFAGEQRFLLIDEPTNHLDMPARAALTKYLSGKKGFILVSHDRTLLDGCTDHIMAINNRGVEIQKGNFSSWYVNMENRNKYELSENRRLENEIDRLDKAARRNADWSAKLEKQKIGTHQGDRGRVGHLAAKMMKRSKVIERRVQGEIDNKKALLHEIETPWSLKIHCLTPRTHELLRLEKISVCYPSAPQTKPLSFKIERGDCIALQGGNGCGKSSILKLCCGEEIPHIGNLCKSGGVIVSYLPQQTTHLSGSLNEQIAKNNVDGTLCKAILHKLGFDRAQFDKDISLYSEGQKKKILIAISLATPAHLFIWDEPLNYIDLISRIQIEQMLLEFSPTMLFVEHDGAFIEKIATKKIQISE